MLTLTRKEYKTLVPVVAYQRIKPKQWMEYFLCAKKKILNGFKTKLLNQVDAEENL